MNSFDINNNNNNYRKLSLIKLDNYPLTIKELEILSDRNNTLNNISNTTSINIQKGIIFQKKPITTKNISFLNEVSPIEADFSKKNLEYDIQISALKKKLSAIKEQRKKSEIQVNMAKLRIKKLLNEEKISIKELEKTKNNIQKIKNNRKKAEKKEKSKNFGKNNKIINNYIKNKTLCFINNNNSKNYINNLNVIDNDRSNSSHNSFHISMKKNRNLNLNSNFTYNFTPKEIYFTNNNLISNSNNSIIANDNYGIYNFRNTSINLDNYNINNINKNRVIPNPITKINKDKNKNKNKIINIRIKNDLKSQIKKNLENKLKHDEIERKKIKEEIRQIEKKQYDLWMNFNNNMNNSNLITNDNINNKKRIKNINDLDDNEEEDNIVNYNFI